MITLAIEAYHRRRAWAAWHAGAAGKFKDLTFDKLAGIPAQRGAQVRAMSVEQMQANLRRIFVSHNAAIEAANKRE